MTHVQRLKPRPYRNKSGKLRQLLARAGGQIPARRCLTQRTVKNTKMVAQYARIKPHPRGYDRWNHALIRRLQNKRFLTPSGHLRTSLRQLLAAQGLHQMSRIERKWASIEERCGQLAPIPELELAKFKQDFNAWYQAGCPETKETYFWRIKYYGRIELGLEGKYYYPLLQAQKQRQARGLK